MMPYIQCVRNHRVHCTTDILEWSCPWVAQIVTSEHGDAVPPVRVPQWDDVGSSITVVEGGCGTSMVYAYSMYHRMVAW